MTVTPIGALVVVSATLLGGPTGLEAQDPMWRMGHRRTSALLDWLITRPDGTEEGNVVGKFIDTYRP
jgi:hypothetical protein